MSTIEVLDLQEQLRVDGIYAAHSLALDHDSPVDRSAGIGCAGEKRDGNLRSHILARVYRWQAAM